MRAEHTSPLSASDDSFAAVELSDERLRSQLEQRLVPVFRELVAIRRRSRLGAYWLSLAFAGAVLLWAGWSTSLLPFWMVAFGVIGAGILAAWPESRSQLRSEAVRAVEHRFPNLDSQLFTAAETVRNTPTLPLPLLSRLLLSSVVQHAERTDWRLAVPSQQRCASWIWSGLGAAAFTCSLVWITTHRAGLTDPSPATSGSLAAVESGGFSVTVEPGDVEVERGMRVLTIARFQGALPAAVTWHGRDKSDHIESMPLSRSLDDPVFGGQTEPVESNLTYWVEFAGGKSAEATIRVFDYPAVDESTIEITPPEYTGLLPRTLERATQATVVEGSKIGFSIQTNVPVAAAELVRLDSAKDAKERPAGSPATSDLPAEKFALVNDGTDSLVWTTEWIAQKSGRWSLKLTDSAGRANRDPWEFKLTVSPNRPPELKLAFPGKDPQVSPLEELAIEAIASDDFGLRSAGIEIGTPGRPPEELALATDAPASSKVKLSALRPLEEWSLQPGDVVSFSLFAVDIGPDGQPRRTQSDLYFAEVRSFESRFMQAPNAPPMEGASNQDQLGLDKLIELQKHVISATWNVRRDALREKMSHTNTEAVKTIADSEKTIRAKFGEASALIEQPTLLPVVARAIESLDEAIALLNASAAGMTTGPLANALSHEQTAYASLLKLRSDLKMIRQQQGARGQSSEAQRQNDDQLNELELKQDRNRYEAERKAGEGAASSATQQRLALLDRLKELARRQQELNDQYRQAAQAHQPDSPEPERHDAEARLKRLRDEQDQLLQDADALQSKLAESQGLDESAKVRQQLELTRQQLADAAAAAESNSVERAQAAGTRAAEQLNRLRDELRQNSAAGLLDAARDLRDQSNDLVERQREIGRAMSAQQNAPVDEPSLRRTKPDADHQAALLDQRQALKSLTDAAKEFVELAEASEPLLAEKVFETMRAARDGRTEELLQAAAQLSGAKLNSEAMKAEAAARAALESLQSGLEDSLSSVFGDDVETLKQARKEIAALSELVRRDLASQPGQSEQTPGHDQSTDGAPNSQNRNGQPGKPGANEPQPGDKPAEGQSSNGQGNRPVPAGLPNGQGEGDQPGSPGEGQPSSQPNANGQPGGKSPNGKSPGSGTGAPSNQPSKGSQQRPGLRGSPTQGNSSSPGGNSPGGSSPGGGPGGPGSQETFWDGFRQWNERLQDVQTLLPDDRFQERVARVRDRARIERANAQRHSVDPNWDLIASDVLEPLVELEKLIADEIARRDDREVAPPADRDPVPQRFRDVVNKYSRQLSDDVQRTETPRDDARGRGAKK